MFTNIRLKNFRSFKDVSLNLESKQSFKRLVLIYGENGMGKSNLALGFSVLNDLLNTMKIKDILDSILSSDNFKQWSELTGGKELAFQELKNQMITIDNIIENYHMVDSNEPIVLEYDFIVNGKKGHYLLEIGEKEIIHEKMEYVLEKNKGIYFDITSNSKKINPKIFNNSSEVVSDINQLINKFWGKHTLLSIVLHEKSSLSNKYIKNAISENFNNLIKAFINISTLTKLSDIQSGNIHSRLYLLPDISKGVVSKEKQHILDKLEIILTKLFNAINSDNRRLYYLKEENEDNIKYTLFIKKFIAGKERNLNFKYESRGNHQIIRILPFLLNSLCGGTIIVDEIDTGIHDLLFKKIIEEMLPNINGQLILTTHNTTLLELNDLKDSIYFITEDEQANKSIKCITEYENRTYQQNNIRNKYFNNNYGGIPEIKEIGFYDLVESLKR
ncbi:AAA family ATPase [Megamonas funiformis]|uniref:AAA family ATPase n=1 Tax=Megamonas funiformis TaxID=437897 RepID=UPI0039F5B032